MAKNIVVALLFLIMLPLAYADGVEIRSFKVYADGKLQYGSVDVFPNSNVTITVEVENDYSTEDDIELEEVNVELTADSILQGDDFEYEFDEFSLDPGERKTLTASFIVPWAIDEDTYVLALTVRADDEDGNSFKEEDSADLVLKKEEHDVVVSDYSFSSEIRCGETATLDLEITNIGKENEDNIILEMENDLLGYSFKDDNIDLEEGEDDSQFSRQYDLAVQKDKKGNYPLEVKITFDDGDREERTFIPFVIICGEKAEPKEQETKTATTQPKTETQPKAEAPKEEAKEEAKETPSLSINQTHIPEINATTVSSGKSIFDGIDETTVLVALSEVLVVFFVVFIVLMLRYRK
ncbi:MAG TPA: hypothetical protein VJI46_01435 [Candidatus Nanoarchaeia archaeon]|nr:hypothetical protein [Candidatus Nanoarchaeia archaeon]